MGTQTSTEEILAQMATQITALQNQIAMMLTGEQHPLPQPQPEWEKCAKFVAPKVFDGSAEKLPAFLSVIKLYVPMVAWVSEIEKR
jgi:hypothetical protein